MIGVTCEKERLAKTMAPEVHLKIAIYLLLCWVIRCTNADASMTNQLVLWRPSQTPVTSGHQEFHLVIKFTSACNVLTEHTVHHDLIEIAKEKCKELENRLFLNELEKMCPTGDFVEVQQKHKRFILTSILLGVIVVGITAAFGLGISAQVTATQAHQRIGNLEAVLAEKEKELDLLSSRVNLAEKAIEQLHLRLDDQEKDYQNLKFKQTGSIYAVSYITSHLMLGQQMLKEAKRQWDERKLHAPLLDFFNYSLPCGPTCPLKFATAKNCRLSFDRTKLFLNFNIPIVNETMKVAVADPFDIIHLTPNQTCTIKYSGPTNVIISTKQHCVYAVNVKHNDLILAPSQDCVTHAATPDTSKYYGLSECKARKPGDAWDAVQIKSYNGFNHVYCFGNQISIGNVEKPCPNQTFVIPEAADFHINTHFYKAGVFNLNHQQENDAMFTLRANWFLQPQVHIDDIVAGIPGTMAKSEDKTDYTYIIITSVLAFCFVLSFVGGVLYYRAQTRIAAAAIRRHAMQMQDLSDVYDRAN